MYSAQVMKIFRHPKNFGKMKNPDAIGIVGNPICGDIMHLYLRIKKNRKGEEIIKDVKFETFGCAAAIATSSAITDLAKGKSLEEAEKIQNETIVSALGGLPQQKIHCSVLAADALKKAIENYREKDLS